MAQEKAKYKKKTLYFNQDNIAIYDYLCSRKDFSDYICKLIRDDLGMPKTDAALDLSKVLSELETIKDKLDNIKVFPVDIIQNEYVAKEENAQEVVKPKTKPKRNKARYAPSEIL